jgi:hypothetical protein
LAEFCRNVSAVKGLRNSERSEHFELLNLSGDDGSEANAGSDEADGFPFAPFPCFGEKFAHRLRFDTVSSALRRSALKIFEFDLHDTLTNVPFFVPAGEVFTQFDDELFEPRESLIEAG